MIQKHDASRLHYDLRLEMNGALKSWALPKGMPYELGVRRLASATEDHPLEYLSFEGVIPKGQYGGGTVMVWDIGTYEIIDGSYYQGRLHVSFAGKKLKGEWLLRKDPSKGPNAWMLEKAGASMRAIPAEKEDESAVTGRTMAQIAADRDAVWQSNRTPVAETTGAAAQIDVDLESLPKARSHFIPPMQAKLVASLPEGEQWEYEAKFDGYRALVLKSGEITILSRNNHDLTNEFREIAAGFADLEEESVVDGEIVGLDEKGAPAFNVLQNRKSHRGAIQFYAFDLLTYRGRDLLSLPLAKRRALLSAALKKTRDPVKFSASLSAETRALVHAARKLGLEGIVAKRLDSRYEPGKRSGAWQKFKLNQTQELVIGGYIPAPKRHFDALLAGYYEGDRLMFAGKIRNGFKDPGSKERVFARFKGLGTDKCPFANLPEPANARRGMALTAEAMKLCCWLKPTLVAEVGIREWTTEGHLRHATFLGLRDDKDPHEVVREAA